MKKKIKAIFCAVFRHSRIHSNCFGYKYCSRCGEQVGDSLAGVYFGKDTVIVGHKCPKCIENYKKLNWIDKFLAMNPFKEDKTYFGNV